MPGPEEQPANGDAAAQTATQGMRATSQRQIAPVNPRARQRVHLNQAVRCSRMARGNHAPLLPDAASSPVCGRSPNAESSFDQAILAFHSNRHRGCRFCKSSPNMVHIPAPKRRGFQSSKPASHRCGCSGPKAPDCAPDKARKSQSLSRSIVRLASIA